MRGGSSRKEKERQGEREGLFYRDVQDGGGEERVTNTRGEREREREERRKQRRRRRGRKMC